MGWKLSSHHEAIFISTEILDLIHRAKLVDNHIADTPMELHLKLRPTDGEPLKNPAHYRQTVGGLVYLSISRPDIAYAVHIVSQFASAPSSVRYVVVLRTLRYLRGTLSRALLFPSLPHHPCRLGRGSY